MRRLIAIPLLVLYIALVSGMMIQLHYCGSRLASWEINTSGPSCCCESPDAAGTKVVHATSVKQKAQQDEDCCSNKTITLKLKQDQDRVGQIQFQLASLQYALPPVSYTVPEIFALPVADAPVAYHANAPPGEWQQIPLYLLHGSFTYYG